MENQCEGCLYFQYDELEDDDVCVLLLDEDETARLLSGHYARCPYFRPGDEYTIVRKQN